MSLDPHWFSSIYGVYVMGGYGLIALAFLIVAAHALAERPPMADVLRARHFSDYGNLMLAFLMLWGYFSISQLIIIWSANLPEEVPWYVARLRGEWGRVGLALVLAHFALPFALLLSRSVKTTSRYLRAVALGVLVMRWVDLYWQAGPIFTRTTCGFTGSTSRPCSRSAACGWRSSCASSAGVHSCRSVILPCRRRSAHD